MENPLFFIRLIQTALAAPDPRQALENAFKTIAATCEVTPYKIGCSQFRQFIEEVTEQWDLRQQMPREMTADIAADFAMEIFLDLFTGSEWETQAALGLVESQESLRGTLSRLQADQRRLASAKKELELIVTCNQMAIDARPLKSSDQTIRLPRIRPGIYNFYLSTGRRLLSIELTDEDLVWFRAYPDQNLRMAADTGKAAPTPSREVPLFGGKLVVQVFPGIESGRIEINTRGLS